MKSWTIFFVMFTATVWGQRADESSSSQRRPKSIPRIYDQRPVVVNMDALFYRDAPPPSSEPELSPEAMRDHHGRRMQGSPVHLNDPVPIPGLVISQEREEDEDSGNRNWLSPMDLLRDDDLFRRDDDLDDEQTDFTLQNPETFDWDALGEQLVEMELEREREAEAAEIRNRENQEREEAEFSIRERDVRGLSLAPVIPQAVAQPNAAQPVNGNPAGAGAETLNTGRRPEPMLPPALRMSGSAATGDREDVPEVSLPGSRAMFDEIGRGIQPEGPPTVTSDAFQRHRAAEITRPPASMPRDTFSRPARPDPVLSPASLSPAAAMSPRPLQPVAAPGGALRPTGIDAPASAPRADPMDIRRFRDDDFRVRPGGDRF